MTRPARPARYGKGEDTLLDRRVRDTWEVPRSRVTIDKRLWANTLGPMLNAVRDDLGLPESSSLKAELHSLLHATDIADDSTVRDLIVSAVSDQEFRLVPLLLHMIDDAELPVTHRTSREGSPHKLVITKTTDLFTKEADKRSAARASLTAIVRSTSTGGISTPTPNCVDISNDMRDEEQASRTPFPRRWPSQAKRPSNRVSQSLLASPVRARTVGTCLLALS